ncbi:hypothetical protein JAAARDRAFT_199378 [Jaapia argillacea MUCL 33604]|uniref:Uncharacterized protein n=1 Tax=Jaapia argillacea MUCL 33604 TaxID=933084 RepID=A0A067PBF4_9AGAM|nr:hypothetical protein JAAARDRAFT_199378 [Jaapia argillacea MUCL 33604]
MDPRWNKSSESLVSRDDTATLVDSASILSLEESETSTLRSVSRASTYTVQASYSQEKKPSHILRGTKSLGFWERLGESWKDKPHDSTSRTIGSPTSLAEQTLELTGKKSNLTHHHWTLGSSNSKSQVLSDHDFSLLLQQYDIQDGRGNQVSSPQFDKTTLKFTSSLNFEGLAYLGRSRLPVTLLGIHAYIHDPSSTHLDGLTGFLDQLPSLNHIWLYFCNENSDDPAWAGEVACKLVKFFQVLATKQCKLFSIVKYPSSAHSSKLELFPNLPPNPNTSPSPDSQIESVHHLRPLASLSTLTVGLPLMFAPPWVYWTARTINLSSIDSLYLTPPSPPDWPSILPLISARFLKRFCIQGITFVDLVAFLYRHQEIENLCPMNIQLDFQGFAPTVPLSLPAGFALPNLRTLIAAPEFALRLLTNTDIHSRPLLRSFILSGTSAPHTLSEHDPYPGIVSLDESIRCIKRVRIPLVEIECSVSCEGCLGWVLSREWGEEDEEESGYKTKEKGGVFRIKVNSSCSSSRYASAGRDIVSGWTFPSTSPYP